MLDDLFDFGSAFDWITPLATVLANLTRGPHHTIYIPYDCGRSGRAIAKLLKRKGIQSWGLMVVEGTLHLTVRRSDLLMAYHVLDQAGIPTEDARPEPEKPKRGLGEWVANILP